MSFPLMLWKSVRGDVVLETKSYGCRALVVQRFEELFSQTKSKGAAELAAESPMGILLTPDTVAKFQV
ncbi:hypothetical protein ACFX1X_006095 [Malus domestica]